MSEIPVYTDCRECRGTGTTTIKPQGFRIGSYTFLALDESRKNEPCIRCEGSGRVPLNSLKRRGTA